MRLTTRSLASLTAIGLSGLIAACSSGSAAAPTSAQALTKVRVVSGNPNISRTPYFVAYTKGFLRDEGLDVEPVALSGGGADAAKLMATNAVDIFIGQVVDAVNINKAGVHVQGVGILTNKSSNGLLIRKDLAPKVKTMADVKGPNYVIGVSSIGSGSWQFTVYVAQLQGVSRDELNIIAVPPAQAEAAFKAGRISMSTAGDPGAIQIINDGVAERFIDLADDNLHRQLIGPEYINDQITVSEALMKSKPALVQSFVNGIQRSLNWMNSSSADDIATELGKTEGLDFDHQILLASMSRLRSSTPKTAIISREAFDNALKLPIATGNLEASLPFETLVDNQFAEKAARALPMGQ